jgi:hypothetical protein
MNYLEIKSNIARTFVNTNEPEVIYLIKTGFVDTYLIVHEDAHEIKLGQTEVLTKEQVEDRYKIEL